MLAIVEFKSLAAKHLEDVYCVLTCFNVKRVKKGKHDLFHPPEMFTNASSMYLMWEVPDEL